MGPSGARDMQAAAGAVCEASPPGANHSEAVHNADLRKHPEVAGCWNKYILAEDKVKAFRRKFFSLILLDPWPWWLGEGCPKVRERGRDPTIPPFWAVA